jgi:hypothetical protein
MAADDTVNQLLTRLRLWYRYNKVVNIPNSMTVLPELVPVAIEMSKRKLTGIMNYTNPGAISHNEILELYKQYIDPTFTWENFTIEEQVLFLLYVYHFVSAHGFVDTSCCALNLRFDSNIAGNMCVCVRVCVCVCV